MKTSAHLIIYISENEDLELWRVLSPKSPEERTAFIKNALKNALIKLEESGKAYSGNIKPSNIHRTVHPLAEQNAPEEIAASEERIIKPLKLLARTDPDNTANSAENENLAEDNLNQIQFEELYLSEIPEQDSAPPGLNFLLTEVIGQEDDETVIEFFKRNTIVKE